MKGIVFTEFMEMVESRFSPEILDQIIEAADLPNGGAYTAVGTYDHSEIIRLVMQLSAKSGMVVPDLLRTFGRHLFGRFVVGFPRFFKDVDGAFPFLEGIEKHIHVEVRKLYPDAGLPAFECNASVPGRLVMVYQSSRGMADLAEGLILGCIEHFGEHIDLQKEDLSEGRNTYVRFILTKKPIPER